MRLLTARSRHRLDLNVLFQIDANVISLIATVRFVMSPDDHAVRGKGPVPLHDTA